MTSTETKLQSFLAKQEINDVLMRYARGVDRADKALLLSCYHADAMEEHGSTYQGPAVNYIEGAIERIRQMGTMCHYLCNVHIELDGDTAWVESYVLTYARFAGDEGDLDTLTGGRLCDRFECRDGEWRIAYRKMAFDWNYDFPANQQWCGGMFDPAHPAMIMGRKGNEDLSYQRF